MMKIEIEIETETKQKFIQQYNQLFDSYMGMHEKIIGLRVLLDSLQNDEADSKMKLSAIAHITEDLYTLSIQAEKQLTAYDEAVNALFQTEA